MFLVSKVAWAALQPSALIALLLVAGAVLVLRPRVSRTGKRLLLAGAFLYIFFGYSPLANWLLTPLERTVEKAPQADLARASGIIVLGGALETAVSPSGEGPRLNERAERMTEAARLSILYPNIPLVFSGGKSGLFQLEDSESDVAARFFAGFNIAPPRLVLEDQSRNTVENAAFTAKLLQPKAGQRWIFITSAFHMPRAKALFEAQGFELIPWPVDYKMRGWVDRWRFSSSPSKSLQRLDLAAKEWVGIVVLWLRGEIAWPVGAKS